MVARHQLRLVVGYIRTLAKVWPQGGKNLEEIQLIAQGVLSRNNEPQQQITPEKSNTSTQKLPVVENTPCIEGLDGWSNPTMALETQDVLSSYWNLSNDFQPDIPVWFSSY